MSYDAEVKTGICKSLTRKLSSFFSAWCPNFKNVIFKKIHWALFEVVEVKRSFSRSLRPNFGFHLVFTNFHLEFSFFGFRGRLTSVTSVTSEGAQGIFSKITFLKSVHSKEKMRHVLALLSKFSLNLSTEEVWLVVLVFFGIFQYFLVLKKFGIECYCWYVF